MDSTLISSNIRKYSRIQLLIEVLIRLEKIMEGTDRFLIGNINKKRLFPHRTASSRGNAWRLLSFFLFCLSFCRLQEQEIIEHDFRNVLYHTFFVFKGSVDYSAFQGYFPTFFQEF